jgi:uncharacterized protein (TIGR03435 family)
MRTDSIKRFTLLGLAAAIVLSAQSPSPAQFEVASIKPANPSAPRGGRFAAPPIATKPGMITASNTSLKQLVEAAWSIEDYQVSGGPPWFDSARFDITAKSVAAADRDQLLLMLRALVTDRFRLKSHRETKQLPVYALTVAKNGPKFHAAKPVIPDGKPLPTNHMYPGSIAALARFMSHLDSDRPVIDRTGLTGNFDLDIDIQKIMEAASEGGGPSTPAKMFDALSTILPDQYGLKLLTTKAPVEILVVDRAEKPSEN